MKYINLGVLAHADAGKTTLVEHLLYRSGALRSPGSIEKGNTQSDKLAVERERGISVRASSVTLTYNDVTINIIDTPGHIDFTGEAERALSALDAAVLVVSAAEGIQSQTEIFWRALRTLDIPTIIFVSKIDRIGCEPAETLASLKKEFSDNIVAINSARMAGGRDCEIREPIFSDDDVLALCELDSALAGHYLRDPDAVGAETFLRSLETLSGTGQAFPLLFGSAALGVGDLELLDALTRYLPVFELSGSGEACGVIYKVEHDDSIGKIAYIRLFSGVLRNREAVGFYRHGELAVGASGNFNKISQIKKITGSKSEDSGVLYGGDSAAVTGLTDSRAGDIVVRYSENADPSPRWLDPALEARLETFANLRLAEPLFSVQVFAGEGLENKMLQAVREFSDEDPLLEYEWQPDERELILKVMGKIQLEIMETRFMERYGLQARFSPPTVIYKETPARPGVGLEAYTMPKPCWAVVQLLAEPLCRGAGFRFESVIKAKVLPYPYQRHVEITVPQALKQGLYNWEVTDVKVTLIGGEHHHVHTHPMDFFLATPIAVMKALSDAGTILLEPLALTRISAPEESSGRIIGDILEMRGTYDTPVIRNGSVALEALLPVSESLDYPVRFASLTSGRGVLKTRFAGYRECPIEFGAIAKRRGINPLDRMRWILHKRNALM